jgi:RNA polymerase sigma-70 factor (ECF subfamily)
MANRGKGPVAVSTGESTAPDLEQLMVAYQAGDLTAFEGLFSALAVPLRNYLTSLARDRARGEDLLQETFLQMHRSRQTYSPGRPVKPWAFGIARHVYLMHRRSAARRARHENVAGDELPDFPVAGIAEMFPDRDDLGQALLQVADNRREAILLHHVWGFTFREVGQMLGITERAAKLRSFRGIQDLRRSFAGGSR